MPRSGEVIHVGVEASVQFIARPINFRVIRVHDWPTYIGWVWLDGYELNRLGDAVEHRSIWVQLAGIRPVGKAPDPRLRGGRQVKPANGAPVVIPRQRSPHATTTGRTR